MKIIENLNFYFIFTIIIFSFLAKNTAFCTLTDIDSPNIKENKSISLCKKGHFYSNVFKLSNQNTIPATNNGQADSSSVVQSEEPVIKRIVYYFGHLSGILDTFFFRWVFSSVQVRGGLTDFQVYLRFYLFIKN